MQVVSFYFYITQFYVSLFGNKNRKNVMNLSIRYATFCDTEMIHTFQYCGKISRYFKSCQAKKLLLAPARKNSKRVFLVSKQTCHILNFSVSKTCVNFNIHIKSLKMRRHSKLFLQFSLINISLHKLCQYRLLYFVIETGYIKQCLCTQGLYICEITYQ